MKLAELRKVMEGVPDDTEVLLRRAGSLSGETPLAWADIPHWRAKYKGDPDPENFYYFEDGEEKENSREDIDGEFEEVKPVLRIVSQY